MEGDTRAIQTRTTALTRQEASTRGRRALCSIRSEINPARGGASKKPTGSNIVSKMVDSMERPPTSK